MPKRNLLLLCLMTALGLVSWLARDRSQHGRRFGEVMAAIEGLSGEFTIILIAHRLSTVERCDLVVELDRGRVVAQGSYGELMARSASFQRMAGIGT